MDPTGGHSQCNHARQFYYVNWQIGRMNSRMNSLRHLRRGTSAALAATTPLFAWSTARRASLEHRADSSLWVVGSPRTAPLHHRHHDANLLLLLLLLPARVTRIYQPDVHAFCVPLASEQHRDARSAAHLRTMLRSQRMTKEHADEHRWWSPQAQGRTYSRILTFR